MKRILAIFVCTFISLGIFFGFSFNAHAQLKSKAELEVDLKNLEALIEQQKNNIDQKQKESASLSRDISILQDKIKQSQLQIKLHEASITHLTQNISEKDKNIESLDEKVSREKDSLAQILRKASYIDTYSLIDFGLQSQNLSDFFIDSDSFLTLQRALNKSFADLRVTKADVVAAKTDLEEAKAEEQAIKIAKELEKKKVESNQKDKKNLLTETKGQEAVYQKIQKDLVAQAAKIRATLFELSGSKAISFGVAYDLAVKAQKLTGIRPALLLGIITEESNLGQNVGKGNWLVDMHPTRDRPLFADICARLGLNPDNMLVSKKQWYGYGGAMGPAQFIPSTWVLYENKVASLTGHTPANPWLPEDAFTASALLLRDNGAIAYNRASEQRSAVCYLAGCGNAKKKSYQFYGNDVMAFADKYEAQIKILQGN